MTDVCAHSRIELLHLRLAGVDRAINDNIVLISRAFRRQFAIPEFEEFTRSIAELYWNLKDHDGGKVLYGQRTMQILVEGQFEFESSRSTSNCGGSRGQPGLIINY